MNTTRQLPRRKCVSKFKTAGTAVRKRQRRNKQLSPDNHERRLLTPEFDPSAVSRYWDNVFLHNTVYRPMLPSHQAIKIETPNNYDGYVPPENISYCNTQVKEEIFRLETTPKLSSTQPRETAKNGPPIFEHPVTPKTDSHLLFHRQIKGKFMPRRKLFFGTESYDTGDLSPSKPTSINLPSSEEIPLELERVSSEISQETSTDNQEGTLASDDLASLFPNNPENALKNSQHERKRRSISEKVSISPKKKKPRTSIEASGDLQKEFEFSYETERLAIKPETQEHEDEECSPFGIKIVSIASLASSNTDQETASSYGNNAYSDINSTCCYIKKEKAQSSDDVRVEPSRRLAITDNTTNCFVNNSIWSTCGFSSLKSLRAKFWNCSRCSNFYYSQRQFMYHKCKLR